MKNTKYVSEATEFLRGLINKPEIREDQHKMRSTWWDKGFIDQEEQENYAKDEIKHDGYVYFSYPTNKNK